MDRELARSVEALRRPLELAAADAFGGLRKVQGLGHALRAACDGLLQKLDAQHDTAPLTQWRATLGTWEQLDEDRQAIEVARGMRLIARWPRAPRPAVAKSAPTFSLPGGSSHANTNGSDKASALPSRNATPSMRAHVGAAADNKRQRTHVGTAADANGDGDRARAHVGAAVDRNDKPQREDKAKPVRTHVGTATRANGDADRSRAQVGVAVGSNNDTPQREDNPARQRTHVGTVGGANADADRSRVHVGAAVDRNDKPQREDKAKPTRTHVGRAVGANGDANRSRAHVGAADTNDTQPREDKAELRRTHVGTTGASADDRSRAHVGVAVGSNDTPRREDKTELQRTHVGTAAGANGDADRSRAHVGVTDSSDEPSRADKAKPHRTHVGTAAGANGDADPSRAHVGTAVDTDDKPRRSRAATDKPTAPRKASQAAQPPVDPLGAPTHSLPGIGPAFAERLAEKGLETVEDLLWCLPRRYDDVRDAKSLAEVVRMEEGMRATFVAKVASSRMVFARGRRWAEVRIGGIDLTQNAAASGDARANRDIGEQANTALVGSSGQLASAALGGAANVSAVVRWFNVWAGIEKRMPAGSVVTLSGVVRKRSGRLELANPDILAIDIPDTGELVGEARAKKALPTIIARYAEITGVPASRLRTACQTACERVGAIADDGVPKTIEAAAQMPSLRETLSVLHAPPAEISLDDLAALNRGDSPWQRRLAFGELFALGVAVALRRRERRADAAVPCARTPMLEGELARALPFELTNAQRRSIRELGDDLERAVPMNRLLQGDVGAGKTAVAFAAALHVARAGRQVAVMAPTELLAEQHAETWKRWVASINAEVKTGAGRDGGTARGARSRSTESQSNSQSKSQSRELRVEILTASTQRGVRQSLLALLAAGEIDILIGTHSLIAEAVGFRALGLVVIDEQHRFGVAQRAKLRDKGDGQGAPHLLVMTATPIPRTLALTAYGDLDVSILDELPPGREPVKTAIVSGKRGEAAAYKLIAERAAAGECAYVVCPKVEDDGESEVDWKDATTVATEIAAALPQLRVGLVHGRLDGELRDRVMRAFKGGELDVLVATTVIEVGVDVPAATVMVIHDAERFGLAQLHQLRGRVGRGTGNAHCLLVTHGGISEDGRRRLDAMVRTTDGFVIAEEDLALRGPGELLGPRQAGVPRLRFGSLAQHTELLLEARRHAERILDEDPDLVRPEHIALRHALTRRLAQSVYGAESG